MAKVSVTDRAGREIAAEGENGISLMEVIRNNGVNELQALCGGSCSCATCHVYIDSTFAERLPPMGIDEDGLLDSSSHRTARSRLSCQINFNEALDGLRITIAPAD